MSKLKLTKEVLALLVGFQKDNAIKKVVLDRKETLVLHIDLEYQRRDDSFKWDPYLIPFLTNVTSDSKKETVAEGSRTKETKPVAQNQQQKDKPETDNTEPKGPLVFKEVTVFTNAATLSISLLDARLEYLFKLISVFEDSEVSHPFHHTRGIVFKGYMSASDAINENIRITPHVNILRKKDKLCIVLNNICDHHVYQKQLKGDLKLDLSNPNLEEAIIGTTGYAREINYQAVNGMIDMNPDTGSYFSNPGKYFPFLRNLYFKG